MYLHPERPGKEAILAVRDHILKDTYHPKLRMEVAILAAWKRTLTKSHSGLTYIRISPWKQQPAYRSDASTKAKSRDFLIKHQDRVLYAADLGLMSWDNPENALRGGETAYFRDWQYFTTEEGIDYGGPKIRGLGLPQIVLRKLYKEKH